jgi:oxygen-dependent protoporphyrinogen oxidase
MNGTGPPPRAVVIGGGVTGLTAALRLLAGGADVIVLERDARLGGKILTERRDGFLLEGGPDAFLAAKPAGRQLCEELGVPLVGSQVAATRASVLWDGRLHPLPEGLRGVFPTRLRPILTSGLFSPLGKVRMVAGRAVPARAGPGDRSLGGYVRHALGREGWERLVEPLVTGVYGGDGDRLSLRAAFPALGATARPAAPAPGPVFLTPAAGVDALVDALRARIDGDRVRTCSGVSAVARAARAYSVDVEGGGAIPADAVVVATPAHEAARILAGIDPALAAALAEIPHASTAVVTVAVPSSALDRREIGHGFVVPRVTGDPVVACSVISSKLPGRAPAGWTLVRTFIGRSGQPDPVALDDDTLVDLACNALRAGLGVDTEPVFARVVRWPHAMPQYTVGHLDRVDRIAAAVAAHPGLAIAGNFLRGIGIPDCIASADAAAASVGRHLAAAGTDA